MTFSEGFMFIMVFMAIMACWCSTVLLWGDRKDRERGLKAVENAALEMGKSVGLVSEAHNQITKSMAEIGMRVDNLEFQVQALKIGQAQGTTGRF